MDFTDVIAGRTTLAQAVVRHPLYPNLYLLTAPVSFGVRLPSKREMQRLIDEIRRHFDFCLIDAAAGIGEAFALATCCADRAVVVTTNDPSSLRDAQRTVMELQRFPSGQLHLVVNRVRRKLLQSLHTTIDDAIDAAGLPLLGVIPEDENVPAVLGRGLSQRLKYRSGALCACRKHRPPPVRRTRASDAAVAPVHKGKHAFPANIFSKPACPCQPMKVPLQ